eukprot:6023720-Amphidinium_carterae.1
MSSTLVTLHASNHYVEAESRPFAQGKHSPGKRWRHTSIAVQVRWSQYILLFGGRDGHQTFGDLWLLDFSAEQWSLVNITGEVAPEARHSHAAVALSSEVEASSEWRAVMLISGGLNAKESAMADSFALECC